MLAVNGRRCFVANDMLYELVRTEQYRADFTVLRDGKTVELPDVQFDTWVDDSGETHMSLGFTVYGIQKTPPQCPERGGQQRALLRADHLHLAGGPCCAGGRASTIFPARWAS